MDNSNIFVTVHRITADGDVKTDRYEEHAVTHQFVSRVKIFGEKICPLYSNRMAVENLFCKEGFEDCKPFEADESSITVIKVSEQADLAVIQRESRIPNIPIWIRCQNCDTNFRTKYQYQRHQCEFNVEKVVLKPDATIKDLDQGIRMKYTCETCGKQFVSKNNLDRHQSSHDSTQDNVCEHCNKQFVTENRLRIHKENHCKKSGDINKFYRSDVTVWKCIKCNQVFATPESANGHAQTCFEKLELAEGSDANIEKVLTELLLQCEFCNRTYSQPDMLMEHQRKHTTACNYECVTCTESFDSYIDATRHWMSKCSDASNLFYLPKMIYCDFCDRTFKSHELLYGHKIKKKHYTPKTYEEPKSSPTTSTMEPTSDSRELVKLIKEVLATIETPTATETDDSNKENEAPDQDQENLLVVKDSKPYTPETNENQEPEKKKRGRKPKASKSSNAKRGGANAKVDDGLKFQCERCPLTFDSIIDLDDHREKGHVCTFSCQQCGQVVHSAKALVIHSRAHQSLKPYVCEQCGRSYSQTSHLWQHMRFHQGIKPFACPHEGCEARYTIRPDLKDHIRKVHTRERPFKCTVCNKCFLTGSVYYQHRLIHTNDRRYGCDMCDKRFFRADALNNHRRIHTDERPYPCEICGREFRQKGDRNKHMRTQHS